VAKAEVVVMCAVVREHREFAFRVNTQGTYNAIRAAVANGIRGFDGKTCGSVWHFQ
jgi:nucleoside-diphosphate-sugar epimerase